VEEWSGRIAVPAATIRTYLTGNIYYTLSPDCIEGIRTFRRYAAELNILPEAALRFL
jgi:chorismate dehydratase